jgi:hypothetical protein
MALVQIAQAVARPFAVAGAGLRGDAEQPVGDARQRRHDDDRPARVTAFLLRLGLALRAHDGHQPLDRRAVGDRRPAKLHDNHVATRSSAAHASVRR